MVALTKNVRMCNDRKWKEIDNDDIVPSLEPIRTESLGSRHNPLQHFDVLNRFNTKILDAGMSVSKSHALLSPDNLRLIYIATVRPDDDKEFGIGFINFNDRSKAFTPMMGESIFVCTNETYSCSTDIESLADGDRVKVRHSMNSNAYLDIAMANIFTIFEDFVVQCNNFNTMTGNRFFANDSELGAMVMRLHKESHFGNTDIFRIIDEFQNPSFEEFRAPTYRNFYNAATHVMKKFSNPMQKMHLTTQLRQIIKSQLALPAHVA